MGYLMLKEVSDLISQSFGQLGGLLIKT